MLHPNHTTNCCGFLSFILSFGFPAPTSHHRIIHTDSDDDKTKHGRKRSRLCSIFILPQYRTIPPKLTVP